MKKILFLSINLLTILCINAENITNASINKNLSIEPLADHPELIEPLFELLYHNMIKSFDTDYTAVKKRYIPFLEKHLQENALPLGYVALINNKPIGLCCLRQKPVSTDEKCSWFKDHPEVFPWIASLFVAPEYTHQGIAKALVSHVIEHAQMLGFEKLYLFTTKGSDEHALYINNGCKDIDEATFSDKNTTKQLVIMEVDPGTVIASLHS